MLIKNVEKVNCKPARTLPKYPALPQNVSAENRSCVLGENGKKEFKNSSFFSFDSIKKGSFSTPSLYLLIYGANFSRLF
jgi:hypothetical protein